MDLPLPRQVELRQKEGHPAVRVFDQPNDSAGRQTVGDLGWGEATNRAGDEALPFRLGFRLGSVAEQHPQGMGDEGR